MMLQTNFSIDRNEKLLKKLLAAIDWTFDDADTQSHTHSIHPYPAKFIPQIPRSLISLLHPKDGSPVFDPFCGSGTTLVEAALAGLPAVGIDLNPLATLITKVKTCPLDVSLNGTVYNLCYSARTAKHPIPDIPNIDHWFNSEVQRALASLTGEINRITNRTTRDIFRIALSSVIVRVSNQESNTRYAAIVKSVTADMVFKLFGKAVLTLEKALVDTWTGLPTPKVRVLTEDILCVAPEKIGTDISLVITSPPYPNAYEYWLYHKYRMYWLGMDPVTVKSHEIGARPHYFKKNPQTEVDFEHQMERCFWLLSHIMRPRGFACFLVGRSIIHGRHIDNEALLIRAAFLHRFHLFARHNRRIPMNRKSFNPSHSTIAREGVLIFRWLP